MKKIFLSLGIILSLGLVGCGNKQNAEKIAEQETKIEELEKKISTIEETADSSDKPTALPDEEIDAILSDIKLDINKKITEAFLDAGLMMYGNKGDGPGENPAVDVNNVDNIPPRLIGMSFYTEPQSGLIITIENFANQEDMDDTIKFHINSELCVLQVFYT